MGTKGLGWPAGEKAGGAGSTGRGPPEGLPAGRAPVCDPFSPGRPLWPGGHVRVGAALLILLPVLMGRHGAGVQLRPGSCQNPASHPGTPVALHSVPSLAEVCSGAGLLGPGLFFWFHLVWAGGQGGREKPACLACPRSSMCPLCSPQGAPRSRDGRPWPRCALGGGG